MVMSLQLARIFCGGGDVFVTSYHFVLVVLLSFCRHISGILTKGKLRH